MSIQLDSVALAGDTLEVHDLPSDAKLLDVRAVEGKPHLAYLHDPDLEVETEAVPRQILCLTPGVVCDIANVDDIEAPIPTNWRVPDGARFFEVDLDDEDETADGDAAVAKTVEMVETGETTGAVLNPGGGGSAAGSDPVAGDSAVTGSDPATPDTGDPKA